MKSELRKSILANRNNQSKQEIKEKSSLIKKRLFQIEEYQHAHTVLFYVSFGSEVDTHEMITQSINQRKQVIIPKTDTKNNNLFLYEYTSIHDLRPGTYGVLEPYSNLSNCISCNEVELVIVPGVVFDVKGNRIGYGKGYYDSLLSTMKLIKKIGLAFELQIIDEIPAEKHDIKLDSIITEQRIITFNQV